MQLTRLSVKDYVQRVADGYPTPGGGSVCALAGSLGAALCLMVANLTLGREKYRSEWPEMHKLSHSVSNLLSGLLELAERDAEAYDGVLSAYKLDQKNESQKEERRDAIDSAMKQAALVPMEVLRALAKLTDFVEEAIEKGNPNCLCDIAVAAQLIRATAIGASYNVRVNLSNIADKNFSSCLQNEMTGLKNNIVQAIDRLEARIEVAFKM
ncbi:methenyltetrahydrofolate cyclohydrolase [Syntrophobacter sp. SbD1]|nr:methenyltetrahydrofolate cyclohydrolase [Syntrophobacter sp. SbD1]